uniref:Uncharacterized protein n=1 Tax=Labrus bergylta TaxID=56723 RepID=A0A3Q3GHA1_9LABR
MKMAGTVQVLNSIKDLKKLDFGPSVPEHSLVLLYWFANTVIINHNNEIRLTFDPRNGDYSSHPYYNHENLLDPLPRAQHDYTIGNLNQGTSVRLPSYVVHPPTSFAVGNMDRIIIRVRGDRIDQVYLTQHYSGYHHHGTEYDPAHTYLITTNLLRQIREFSMGGNYQSLLNLRDRFRSNHVTPCENQKWESAKETATSASLIESVGTEVKGHRFLCQTLNTFAVNVFFCYFSCPEKLQ